MFSKMISNYFKAAFCSVLVLCGCATAESISSSYSAEKNYSDSWWQVVPESELKSWEIPPQAANRSQNEVILSKRTELGIFSNLSDSVFTMDNVQYSSLEGLWQGMKYPENANDERLKDPTVKWLYTREQVYKMSGFESKKAGDIANENMKKLGIKWITYRGQKIDYNSSDEGRKKHYEIILQASREKVLQNPAIHKLLIQTKGLQFFPDHKQQINPAPAYKYHEIYMKVRYEISP